jgi:hypothetical protein
MNNRKNIHCHCVLIRRAGVFLVLMTGLLITLSLQAAQPDTTGGPARPVVIENQAPIPVSGEVNASVSGQVEVVSPAGEALDVSVISTPISVTDRLDSLITAVEDLRDEVAGIDTQTQVANYSRVFSGEASPLLWFTDETEQLVMASLISVSTENDSGIITFCSDTLDFPIKCSTSDSSRVVLKFGKKNKEFPGVLVVPLPQPVPIRSFTFSCENLLEDCEITVTITGTVVSN